MKKEFYVIPFAALMLGMLLLGTSHGAPLSSETPILAVSEADSVVVSSSAWTVSVATDTLAGRVGIFVSNPETGASAVAGVLSIGAPSEATTVRPFEIGLGEDKFIPVNDQIDLYLISVNGSPVTVHTQQIRQ